MRSSTGKHYLALDHVRAVAAFTVFVWHFTHAGNGYPVPFSGAPSIFPFFIFDEGHTGVAIFMSLSGYLFAKLLEGKRVSYPRFIWNRCVRLVPLLMIVIVVHGAISVTSVAELHSYILRIAAGILLPTLPNGGWSITVEAHFYVILPFLMLLIGRSSRYMVGVLVAAITIRYALYVTNGEVQSLAYGTIIGRIDQFVLGIVMFHYRIHVKGLTVFRVLLLFAVVYWLFNQSGGFYLSNRYPSDSPIWIILPTLEGLTYAMLIAWYDTAFKGGDGFLSKLVGRVGELSYSIYLLHFFFVFHLARYIHENIMDISNFYVAFAWSIAAFALMIPISHLSYRIIEAPFLKHRTQYVIENETPRAAAS